MSNLKVNPPKFFKDQSYNWEKVTDGISRKYVGFNQELMMMKIKFEKGAVGELHHHFHHQASYVASGKFEIEIEGEKQILSQGDGFFVQPDLVHGAKCLEAGILIDVFNPVREDFL